MDPKKLRGLVRAIHDLNEAHGAYNKAKAFYTLSGQIYDAGGFSAAFKVIKDKMTMWDWIKIGVTAVAQITVWFGTRNVAFNAKVALKIMDAEQLLEGVAKAVKVCSN